MHKRWWLPGGLVWLALASCEPRGSGAPTPAASSRAVSSRAGTAGARLDEAPPAPSAARDPDNFARAFTAFSEPTEEFFSDNLISNETSYLQVASPLARRSGGAYIGVGPEQNFSYIALSRPELAIIVDIRRDNALLHLLYKAIFERAKDRAEFLCLLLGRDGASAEHVGADAPLPQLLDYVGRRPRDGGVFRRLHAELMESVRRRAGLQLTEADFRSIERMHSIFSERGLGLRFELHQANGRHYPSLEQLLKQRSPDGELGGFLAREADFQFVRQLERQDRVLFVVGDFGKQGALGRIAAELERRKLVLRTFYVSNVEQYLFGSPAWQRWLDNLRAFPLDADSALVRAYLDQGKRHPLQLADQRSASFLVQLKPWLECEAKTASPNYFAAVSRDGCGLTKP